MLLADFGAQVTWVESPDEQNRGRTWAGRNGLGDYWVNPLCRGKRSIVVDLKTDGGKGVLLRLASQADVLVEGFRPGVLDGLGLGYETLKVLNPGLIQCSISAFGQTGRRARLPGHDLNFLALTGALSLAMGASATGVVPGNLVGDMAGGGLFAVIGILLALSSRASTGMGQLVDVSMTDSIVSMMGGFFGALQTGMEVGPMHHRLTGQNPRYNVYRTKSGDWVALGGGEEKFWQQVLDALGLPATPEPTYSEVAEAVARHDVDVFEMLDVACVSVVRTIEEAFDDPLFFERGAFIDRIPGTHEGDRQIGVMPILGTTPGRVADAGSPPGTDTRRVLQDVGFSECEIDNLVTNRAVVTRDAAAGSNEGKDASL